MDFFSNKFKRQKTPEGSYQYWFTTSYKQDEKNANEKPPISVDGETVCAANGFSYEEEQNAFKKLPEEIYNPVTSKQVFDQWLHDCSSAFVKPPTIEQCLANVENIWDSNAPIAVLDSAEETSSWTLQWIPTKIKVDPPHFQIYWAPSFKTIATRIPEFGEENDTSDLVSVELQDPEKSYNSSSTTRLITAPTRLTDWTQELTEVNIPLSDSPALRLNIDSQREKFRQRVREARIRAKLARYRAERLAQRYEEKFGDYPEEDKDEAETEVDQSDEE